MRVADSGEVVNTDEGRVVIADVVNGGGICEVVNGTLDVVNGELRIGDVVNGEVKIGDVVNGEATIGDVVIGEVDTSAVVNVEVEPEVAVACDVVTGEELAIAVN